MINRNGSGQPTTLFWNCVGIAIAVLSVGMSWSIIQNKIFELEIAQYKLKTVSAIANVQKASNTLEQAANALPPKQKKKIKQLTSESTSVLEKAETTIEQEVKQLVPIELAE